MLRVYGREERDQEWKKIGKSNKFINKTKEYSIVTTDEMTLNMNGRLH